MGRLKQFVQILEWIAAGFIPVVAAFRTYDISEYKGVLSSPLGLVQESAVLIIFWLATTMIACKVLQASIDHSTARREEIKRILDALHKNFFQDVPGEERFRHRVTLFKAKRYWTFGRFRYLSVFARSGTQFQKSKTWFAINDECEDENEGVAGRAWFLDAMFTVTDLPNWRDGVNYNENVQCRRYAEDGHLSLAKSESLEIKSRSISAVVVRNKAGERWGVLVLDSQEPQGISMDPVKKAMFNLVADLLTAHT